MLTMKDETIKDLEITIKVTKEKLNKVFDEIKNQNNENVALEKKNQEKLEISKRKLNETKDICTKISETYKKNNENLSKQNEIKNLKTDEFDRNLKKNKDVISEIEKKMIAKQAKVEELENLINQIAKTKTTKSYADIFEFLEINDDMLSICIDNNSRSESLDELSGFMHKMRKSLAKASEKKSMMYGHSLIKKSYDRLKMKREKRLGITQHGFCCGSNDCKVF